MNETLLKNHPYVYDVEQEEKQMQEEHLFNNNLQVDDNIKKGVNESKNEYDLVIHSSAVGDYKPEFSFRMEDLAKEISMAIVGGKVTRDEILNILTNPNCKVNDNTKISSYEPNLTVKLTLTKAMTENNTGLINNTAEIGESYNDLGIKDSKSTSGNKAKGESDYGSADAILSLKTGEETYIAIAAVTTLKTEPGSYESEITLLRH